MTPSKEEMLEIIQEKVWEKRNVWNEYVWDIFIEEVMIGDIFKWIDDNCNWVEFNDEYKSRNLNSQKELVLTIYNLFIGSHNEPMNKQPDEKIEYIYNLVK